jgi:hypothetical protein
LNETIAIATSVYRYAICRDRGLSHRRGANRPEARQKPIRSGRPKVQPDPSFDPVSPNNPVENAIRPVALGRKNWLFAGSDAAGRRAAAIMSLLATAKANGREPHAWLSDVLARLPTTLDRNIDTLLPHRWAPAER